MLYFEVPPGVGFSKKDKDKVNWNDNEIANATAWAIIDFFTNRFTKYKNCDLFIGGDGYGGGLALRVEDYLDAWSGGLININVEGLLLGNPCILSQECDDYTFPYKEYFYKFLYHRGLYSEDLDTQVEEHCNSFNITEMTKECKKALDTINEMIAGLNLYNY